MKLLGCGGSSRSIFEMVARVLREARQELHRMQLINQFAIQSIAICRSGCTDGEVVKKPVDGFF